MMCVLIKIEQNEKWVIVSYSHLGRIVHVKVGTFYNASYAVTSLLKSCPTGLTKIDEHTYCATNEILEKLT